MDFTEPYHHSQFLTLYSPNGKYLASYHLTQEGFTRIHPSAPVQPQEDGGKGVIIFRFAATMQIMRVIEIKHFRDSLPTISEIGWSPDSTMLLAACPMTGTVLVYSVEEEDFKVTITVPGIISGSFINTSISSNSNANNKSTKSGVGQKKGGETSAKQIKALKTSGYSPPGAEFLRGVRFSADSRHVLIWEEHLLRLSIWSLESASHLSTTQTDVLPRSLQQNQPLQGQSGRVLAIQNPKAMSKSYITSGSVPPYSTLGTTATSSTGINSQYIYSLRGDLQYMAVAERRECKDYISIYATEDYWCRPPIHSFGINTLCSEGATSSGGIKDVDGVVWSPNGRYLLVWENPLLDFKIAIFSIDGRCVGSYSVPSDVDSNLGHLNGHQGLVFGSVTGGGGMGVKSVCWHPDSKIVALGGYDQKIRLISHLTWKPVLELAHSAYIKYGPSTVLWRESESITPVSKPANTQGSIEYTVVDQPAWIPSFRIDTTKPNAKFGISWCDFNCDGTLLASRNDNMPNAVWIWSMGETKPIVIIQQQSPVKMCRWDPISPSRIVWCCSGSGYIYSWRASSIEKGGIVEAIEVPSENFEVSSLKWCPDGKGLLLLDKDLFCIGFPIEEEDEEQYTIHENTASIFSK